MTIRRIRTIVLAAASLCLSAAASAQATTSVFWVNFSGEKVSRTGFFEGGGADIPIDPALIDGPFGLAIDAAAGRIYWANYDGNTIGYSNADGTGGGLLNTTGATVSGPSGLAIDPAGGRIYWANYEVDEISFANLNGSGGGDLDTGSATLEGPNGIAVDPTAGRVYWANFDANAISFANVDGTGGGDLDTTGATVSAPDGVAIDPTTERIYWANFGNDSFGYANLSGGGGGPVATTGPVVDEPVGLAIDPVHSLLFWANAGTETLPYTSLLGVTAGQLQTAGATLDDVSFPVLADVPRNLRFPEITSRTLGTPRRPLAALRQRPSGQVPSHAALLTCSSGEWAGDLVESFLYRAPQTFSYQWQRNNQPIAGATSSVLSASLVGEYVCEVTASNLAGASSQPSGSLTIAAKFKLGRIARNVRKGTARLPVAASGAGKVSLTGKGLVSQRKRIRVGTASHLKATLLLRVKGGAKGRLNETGQVKVKARIAYTPSGGKPLRRTKTVVLRKRLRD
ncbi:MAG TPA: hypothetical protein VNM89_04915 [Solirubrobacterales bacterium]|nr:hypothetical protein [Solirubrobacterales bacterium]